MYTRKVFTCVVAVLLCVGVLALAAGCKGPQPTPKPTESPLPAPVSPLAAPTPFESPLAEPGIPGPAFAIDQPLLPGATQITGQGPAGIPVVIIDVTMTGQELGSGFIDDTGRFDIQLAAPLEAGHRVGIMAGMTEPMTPEQVQAYIVQLDHWKGEGAMNLPPYIGMVFASAMVEE